MQSTFYNNIKNIADRPVLFSCSIISFLSFVAILSFGITFYITSSGVEELVKQEENRNQELISSNNLVKDKYIFDEAIDAESKQMIDTKKNAFIHKDSLGLDAKSNVAQLDTLSKQSKIITSTDSVAPEETKSVIRLVNKSIYDNILNKQAKLNADQIIYSIRQSYYHLSFYNGLIAVIIVFTTLMSISIFMISHKGWNGSSVHVKVFGLTVIIILGLANLVNTVIKPKENFNNYVKSVKKSSTNQIKIFDMINGYARVPVEKMDSVLSKNFEDLNSNIELLPNINEEKLSSSAVEISDVTGI